MESGDLSPLSYYLDLSKTSFHSIQSLKSKNLKRHRKTREVSTALSNKKKALAE